ncbi:MAG TPA: DUF4403 family protein [Bacteroidales bacterium]|jgi:hypothetical protein|nr:DUF4403 family protein [Bacteroidales bacterium]
MKRILFSLLTLTFAIFALSFLSSCRTTMPAGPAESYKDSIPQPKPSIINIPVEMKLTNLESLLNKQLTGIIYEDSVLTDDNLAIKAWKKENIKLGFDKGQFVYRVPLKLWIKAGWKIEKFGISLSDYREVNAEIALKFKTAVAINKDWTLVTKTVSDGYEWLSSPVLKIGPVNLPITFIADMIIKSNMPTINKAIDEGLKSSLDLKTTAQQAWEEVQKPMLLDEEYKLWLKVSPQAVFASPITVINGVVRQTSAIQGVAECFAGKMPAFVVNPSVPNINPDKKLADNFVVNLLSYTPFDYIDSVSKAMMLNTTYTFGKKSITITGITVYGSSENMIIETNVTGSIKGKLYFQGVPAYRASDSSIVMQNLAFHIDTQSFLLKTANWLYNGGIEKIMQKKMVYPIGADIRETYALVQESITHYDLGEGFYLNGKLTKMEVEQPVLSKGFVVAPLAFEGKVSVVLEEAGK